MTRALTFLLGITLCFVPNLYSEVLIFMDGSEIDVETYEIRGNLIVFTTTEGKIRSVIKSLVNLEQTLHTNRITTPPVEVETQPSESRDHGLGAEADNEVLGRRSTTKAEKLLELFGVKSLIFQMPSDVSAVVGRAERYVVLDEPEISRKVRVAFEKAFQPDTIYRIVSDALAKDSQEFELDAALVWLRLPLIQRMNELESFARTTEGLRLLRDYAVGLENTMPSAARIEILQRLDEATGVTAASIQWRVEVLRAVFQAFNQVAPVQYCMTDEEMDPNIRKIQSELRVSTKNDSLVNHLFVYRSATDAELSEYVSFWETDRGQWLKRLNQNSLSVGVTHGLGTAMKHTNMKHSNQASEGQ